MRDIIKKDVICIAIAGVTRTDRTKFAISAVACVVPSGSLNLRSLQTGLVRALVATILFGKVCYFRTIRRGLSLDMVGVTGSIPVAPTIIKSRAVLRPQEFQRWREVGATWAGLPRYGYGTFFRLRLGAKYQRLARRHDALQSVGREPVWKNRAVR